MSYFVILSRIVAIAVLVSGLAARSPLVIAVETQTDSEIKFAAAFAVADRDGDKQLSLEEFQAQRGANGISKRDFLLFDLDKSGGLSLVEFSTVPDAVAGVERGPLPDPFEAVVDRLVGEIDKSIGKWNERPDVEVDANQFIQGLNASFMKKQIPVNAAALDADSNGRISRAEARRFLEMQLGVRNGAGVLLRHPNGQLINYALFVHIDENRNGQLERDEFVARSFSPGAPEKEFDAANTDDNRTLSVEEFGRVPGRGTNDPVLEFLQMDTNLDAFLSPDEVLSGTVDWKKKLSLYVFPGFDVDRDGKLSLAEYQFTPQANAIAHWTYELADADGDGKLSFPEFQLDPSVYPPLDGMQFPLLRFLYFQRLDVNSDGRLDPKEFAYRRKIPDEFFVMNADGTDWKSLFLFEGHSACGSVAVSPDGKSLAFDAWPGVQRAGSAIYVMDLESLKPREICIGMMPSWSPDSRFLTCSRSGNPYGVWLIDADNDKLEHVCGGWGAQWSPDGRQIAFYEGREIKVFDIADDDVHTVLDEDSNPYQILYWNMAWSPDGQRLCLKGTKADGTHEVATVNTTGDKRDVKVHYSGKGSINADFAWHPSGDRVVFAMSCPERGVVQLYEFNPSNTEPPKLVVGQDATRNNTDLCWSFDGKRLFVVSGDF